MSTGEENTDRSSSPSSSTNTSSSTSTTTTNNINNSPTNKRKKYNIRHSVLQETSSIINVLEKKVQKRAHTQSRFTLAGFELDEGSDFATQNEEKVVVYGAIDNGDWLSYYAKCLNCLGGSTTIKERGWIMYDIADSPITFAQMIYSLMLTLYLPRATWFKMSIFQVTALITTLKASLTFFFYLSFSSSAEYGRLKSKFLWYAAHAGGLTLILSVFIFSPNWAVVLLIVLDILHKICYRICSVAYDALLFPATNGEPARQHMVQSVAVIIGYLIMAFFACVFIALPMGVSYLLHDELLIGEETEKLEEDTFLNIMFLQFKLPLMFLGVWWIVFTRQSFWLLGKIPYGLPYPKGLIVKFNCCGYTRYEKNHGARTSTIEMFDNVPKRQRFGSDLSVQSDETDSEIVQIKNVEDITVKMDDSPQKNGGGDEAEQQKKESTSTTTSIDNKLAIEEEEGRLSTVEEAYDGKDEQQNTDEPVHISREEYHEIKSVINSQRKEHMRKNSSTSIPGEVGVDLTLEGYSTWEIIKFAFLQGIVEIGRTFVTLYKEEMRDLYVFLICSCLITDGTSNVTNMVLIIVTKSWSWSVWWMGIGLVFAVSVSVFVLMTVRKLIKTKKVKTFAVMRVACIAMFVSLIWLILIDMPPVEYKDESMSATAAVAGDNINVTSTSAPTKGKRVSWTQDRVGAHVHAIFVLTIYLSGNMVFTAFLKSSICSLTPEHLQSSVFAIAELTQKGTSIFSPLLLLGLLAGVADENIQAKITLGVSAFVLFLGIPFFFRVQEKRGNKHAENIDKLHLKKLQREASIALGLSIKRLSQQQMVDDGDDDAEVDGKISTI